MPRDTEGEPAIVSGESGTKQAGETHARWAWVEPCVWTQPMLTALENGVKGGKCLLCGARALQLERGPRCRRSILDEVRPPTGEPYAGEPHVRFGGRGNRATGFPYPYPKIKTWFLALRAYGKQDARPTEELGMPSAFVAPALRAWCAGRTPY